ncbi:hypothetical protein [Halorhabdus salina]|uniref:hypothetical protein n=1 Tax=Halorhabdus salina TaxID=2750670 RepID=UPI0015EF7A49|nr:hypothetical protein [Halorhabdus salina]
MAQFTFIELHFEEGAIPGMDGLGGTRSDDTTDQSVGDEDDGGPSILKIAGGILLAVAAIAIVRQLLGDDASPLETDDVLDEADELVE